MQYHTNLPKRDHRLCDWLNESRSVCGLRLLALRVAAGPAVVKDGLRTFRPIVFIANRFESSTVAVMSGCRIVVAGLTDSLTLVLRQNEQRRPLASFEVLLGNTVPKSESRQHAKEDYGNGVSLLLLVRSQLAAYRVAPPPVCLICRFQCSEENSVAGYVLRVRLHKSPWQDVGVAVFAA